MYFNVDVAIWQQHDLTLVGTSLLPDRVGGDVPLLSVAMVSNFHFWGVVALDVNVVPYVDKGDMATVKSNSAPANSTSKRGEVPIN